MKQKTSISSLIDSVKKQLTNRKEATAYTFVQFENRSLKAKAVNISFEELDQNAKRIAGFLQSKTQPQDNVVLAYRSGVDFLYAFLGCLYAGVVAVPAPLPKLSSGKNRLAGILTDTNARYVLTSADTELASTMADIFTDTQVEAVATDGLSSDYLECFEEKEISPDDLAFLQYSSGSGGLPKGVMVSHKNINDQLAILTTHLSGDENSCMASWLPHFHDMGLILGLLHTLYIGGKTVFMSPDSFIRNPITWLKLLSDYQADYTVAPNFSFDLCCRQIELEQCAGIDLSKLKNMGNSAEPVRASTIKRFSEKFAPLGFNSSTFTPSYGLAEATLLVASRVAGSTLKTRHFSARSIEKGLVVPCESTDEKTRELVSYGRGVGGFEIKIVNPETKQECEASEVGEILLTGGSLTQGYWNKPELNKQDYHACIAGDSQEYLRTGDLGFIHYDELYLCGRLKDLILVHGVNHHAIDIEATVVESDAMLVGAGAAFALEADDEERLIVLQEVDRKVYKTLSAYALLTLGNKLNQAIVEQHEISAHTIALVPKSLPKTTSGKIQRQECLKLFNNGQFADYVVFEKRSKKVDASPVQQVKPSVEEVDSPKYQKILNFIAEQIAHYTRTALADFSTTVPLKTYNMSGEDLVSLQSTLQRKFNCQFVVTQFEEVENAAELARFLASNNNEDLHANILSAEELSLAAKENTAEVSNEPIAIIGLGCRFPQAKNHFEFWQNLCAGVDAVTDVPGERWDIDTVYHENPLALGKMNTRRGGFLDKIDLFDRKFFGISVREATRMDPAHRKLLEVAWEMFENAGIKPENIEESKSSVYIGISGSDYAQLQFTDELMADAYAGLGSALTNAASRISHFFNLRGPALAVDTACSSSLSAVHMACSSIRSGESEMALAGGVNILLSPTVTMSLTKAGMMAPDGKCKTFDDSANGYVRSEGIGLVLLKPLSKAEADGDHIYAVIKGSASNQDGKSSGISAPNGQAQQAVIMAACQNANIQPGELDYVEAHGTGTSLGDPIEINALSEVLKIGAIAGSECGVGSVKTNIGHAESAAGIASIIKSTLMLNNNLCPKSLHFETPNSAIDFDSMRVKVQTELTPLRKYDRAAMVGVNSFGVGGTNVHVILNEYHSEKPSKNNSSENANSAWILPISGQSVDALKNNAKALAAYLDEENSEEKLADIAYTLAERRTHMMHRLVVNGQSAKALSQSLINYADSVPDQKIQYGVLAPGADLTKLVFVFSGQGSQWWGMGQELMTNEPIFREKIVQCDKEIRKHVNWSLLDELAATEADSKLNETEYAQPAIFAIQVALAALWQAWGVVPSAVTGHSVGEVSAAYVAGVISFEDACKIIVVRAKLMQNTTGKGCMVSVESTPDALEKFIANYQDKVCLAAINGPKTCVLSGETAALDSLIHDLELADISCMKLKVNYAFHSYQMEECKQLLIEQLKDIQVNSASIPLVSTVTGDWITDINSMDAQYWGDNVRNPVLLQPAMLKLIDEGYVNFIELSARAVLKSGMAKTLNKAGVSGHVLASLHKDQSEQESLSETYGQLHLFGYRHQWSKIQPHGNFDASLPNYAWDHQRFWLDGPHIEQRIRTVAHPLIKTRLPVANQSWDVLLDNIVEPLIASTRIKGKIILPTSLINEVLSATNNLANVNGEPLLIKNIRFKTPLVMEEGQLAPAMQVSVFEQPAGYKDVIIKVQLNANEGKANHWRELARADLVPDENTSSLNEMVFEQSLNLATLETGFEIISEPTILYKKFAEIGFECDKFSQLVTKLWFNSQESVIEITPIAVSAYDFEPRLFEGAEQACRILLGNTCADSHISHIEQIKVTGQLAQARYMRAVKQEGQHAHQQELNVILFDQQGAYVGELKGVVFQGQNHNHRQMGIPQDTDHWQYLFDWQMNPIEVTKEFDAKTKGTWLLLADDKGVSARISSWLLDHNQKFVMVYKDETFSSNETDEYVVNPSSPDDFNTLITSVYQGTGQACAGVVNSWMLDSVDFEQSSAKDIANAQAIGSISTAYLIQSISNLAISGRPRLWLLTRNAQTILEQERVEVSQAPVWGLSKTIAIEHPELHISRIDIDSQLCDADIDGVCQEISANLAEDQIAFRSGERYVNRLTAKHSVEESEQDTSLLAEEADSAYQLILTGSGTDKQIKLVKDYRKFTTAGTVEVAVAQTLINYNLSSQNDSSEETLFSGLWSGNIGNETSQKVVSLANVTVAKYATIEQTLLTDLPESVSLAEVGCSIRPYVLAYLTLENLAKGAKGQKIFIQGIDSITGFACFKVAKRLGMKVFGSLSGIVHEMDLTGAKVLSGNEGAEVDKIKALAGENAIDVFINCLYKSDLALAEKSLSLFGLFVDLSVQAQGQQANISRFKLRKNIRHQSVSLNDLIIENYGFVKPILEKVLAGLDNGLLAALPQTNVTIAQLTQSAAPVALSAMLSFPEQQVTYNQSVYKKDGTYVITGGLGGLGLTIAKRLSMQGAGHIVLLGRKSPSLALLDEIAKIEQLGAKVTTKALDVSVNEDVKVLFADLKQNLPPVKGVFHAAGVLRNALLIQLTEPEFNDVFAAKISGAWNLHQYMNNESLDFFMMFSSLASAIGSPGQSNYAAANAFLDALAEYRQQQNMPALSVSWGPWEEVGMAAEDSANLERLSEHGIGTLDMNKGLCLIDELVKDKVQKCLAVLPMNWALWSVFFPALAVLPYFEKLVPEVEFDKNKASRITRADLENWDKADQLNAIKDALHKAVCQSMMVEPETLSMSIPLTAVGLDSIVALELKTRIEVYLDVVVQTFTLLKGHTIEELAALFLTQIFDHGDIQEQTSDSYIEAQTETEDLLENLGEMSVDEVDKLLQELASE
jgi:phthiocerol/phenolphthiocerol synthesis type-I polyketide synthase C